MHRSFIISEEERNRILNFHKNSTKNNYIIINEQVENVTNAPGGKSITDILPCLTKHPKIIATEALNTYNVNSDVTGYEYTIDFFPTLGVFVTDEKGKREKIDCNSPLFSVVTSASTYENIKCVVDDDDSIALLDGRYVLGEYTISPNGDAINNKTNVKGTFSCPDKKFIKKFEKKGDEIKLDDNDGYDEIVTKQDYYEGEPERTQAVNLAEKPTQDELSKDKELFKNFPCVLEQKDAVRIKPDGEYIKQVIYRVGNTIYYSYGKKQKLNQFLIGEIPEKDYSCSDEFEKSIYGLPNSPKTMVGKLLWNALHSINNIKDYEYLETVKKLEMDWPSVSGEMAKKQEEDKNLKEKNRADLLANKAKYSREDVQGSKDNELYKAGDVDNYKNKKSSWDMEPWPPKKGAEAKTTDQTTNQNTDQTTNQTTVQQ